MKIKKDNCPFCNKPAKITSSEMSQFYWIDDYNAYYNFPFFISLKHDDHLNINVSPFNSKAITLSLFNILFLICTLFIPFLFKNRVGSTIYQVCYHDDTAFYVTKRTNYDLFSLTPNKHKTFALLMKNKNSGFIAKMIGNEKKFQLYEIKKDIKYYYYQIIKSDKPDFFCFDPYKEYDFISYEDIIRKIKLIGLFK